MAGSPPRISLGELAYRRLRNEIISCQLAPGQRLTEKQLAADMGFGSSPVREALTRLDHDGLVRTLPRKGCQVAPLTPKAVDDLFDAWSILGPELVRRGVANATDDERVQLRRLFSSVSEHTGPCGPREEDREHLLDLTDAAFQAIAGATHNEMLIDLFQRLSGNIRRTWSVILTAYPDALTDAVPTDWPEHIFSDRDTEAAADNARRYIASMHERVVLICSRWPSVMSTAVVPIGPPQVR